MFTKCVGVRSKYAINKCVWKEEWGIEWIEIVVHWRMKDMKVHLFNSLETRDFLMTNRFAYDPTQSTISYDFILILNRMKNLSSVLHA